MKATRKSRAGSLPIVFAAIALFAPAGSSAQEAPSQPVEQIKKLLELAIQDYDNVDLQKARQRLESAETIARVHRIADRIVAEVHLRLGLIHVVAGRPDLALLSFVDALKVDPDLRPDPAVMTPKANLIWADAKARMPAPIRTPTLPTFTEADFLHVPPGKAWAGDALAIRVTLATTRGVRALVLAVQYPASSLFERYPMRREGPRDYVFELPGERVQPSRLRYFVEVRGDEGAVLYRWATPEAPRTVEVEVRKVEPTEPRVQPGPDARFLIAVGGGTGIGIVSGKSEVEGRDIEPGTAFAPVHVHLELGWIATRSLEVTLLTRLQVLSRKDNKESPLLFGVSPRVNFHFVTTDLIQAYLSGGFAYARMRYRVESGTFIDTLVGGFFGVGFGMGFSFRASKNFGIGLELNSLTLLPDAVFGVDLGLRVRVRI